CAGDPCSPHATWPSWQQAICSLGVIEAASAHADHIDQPSTAATAKHMRRRAPERARMQLPIVAPVAATVKYGVGAIHETDQGGGVLAAVCVLATGLTGSIQLVY